MRTSVGGVVGRLQTILSAQDAERQSDRDLLLRFVQTSDQVAFEVIVWRHGPMVLGVCRRLLRNSADAEDAFQATFMVLVRREVGCPGPKSWLVGSIERPL